MERACADRSFQMQPSSPACRGDQRLRDVWIAAKGFQHALAVFEAIAAGRRILHVNPAAS
jgi:hypothetical protein